MSQFTNHTQKVFYNLKECISRFQEINKFQTRSIHNLQEDHNKLSRATEGTNRRLNLVLVEKHHSKRDMENIQGKVSYMDKDMNKTFNVFQIIEPKNQGFFNDNIPAPYQQEKIKQSVPMERIHRSP
ncbi:hypothetical protein O181_018891 [Austropuccinia psidii MF-1]|uniref:Uncharacterized protein n=1 Tax=Austropuccinia psidii MF-1 TaxID=1389203 RepID=A0A9Q3C653_9BASI|nr:hypothetical protein [Austropuccinia psidii MF-1]